MVVGIRVGSWVRERGGLLLRKHRRHKLPVQHRRKPIRRLHPEAFGYRSEHRGRLPEKDLPEGVRQLRLELGRPLRSKRPALFLHAEGTAGAWRDVRVPLPVREWVLLPILADLLGERHRCHQG